MNLLGGDPGENSGLAWFRDGELIDQWTVGNAAEGMFEFIKSGQLPHFDRIVLESFIVEPDFVGRAHASEVIGVLMSHAWSIGAEVSFQSRSQKALVTRGTETERFNWLRSFGHTGSSHELDAITHGLLRLRREKHMPTIRKYWL